MQTRTRNYKKTGGIVEYAQPSSFSCSEVPKDPGTEFDCLDNVYCFFTFQPGFLEANIRMGSRKVPRSTAVNVCNEFRRGVQSCSEISPDSIFQRLHFASNKIYNVHEV